MDIFNQNWTEQMKNNPFVNKLLNNYEVKTIREFTPGSIKYRSLRKIEPKRGSKRPYTIRFKDNNEEYNQANLENLKEFKKYFTYPGKRKAKMNKIYYKPGSSKVTRDRLHIIHYRSKNELLANTRPQSLYNLRYACLR